jgi:hypothetical protein
MANGLSREKLGQVAAATLLAAAFAFHGAADLPSERAKVVRSAQPFTSSVNVPVEATRVTAALATPFAAIWRVRNETASTARFELLLDGHPVCAQEVKAGRARRIDCAVTDPGWRGDIPHVLTVAGPDRAALEYAELASHHGGTGGWHRLAIVPRGARIARPPALLALGAWAALLALYLLVRPAPLGRRLAAAHRAVAALVLAFCVLTLAAPFATPFELILAPSTWLLWVALASAPRLVGLVRSANLAVADPRLRRATLLVLLAGVAVWAAATIVTATVGRDHQGNYSGLIHIERQRYDRHPLLRDRADIRGSLMLEDDGGYDGQFVYFALYDPWLRKFSDEETRGVIDVAPYRYARSGFVWLTKAVSFDRWTRYPATMVWLTAAGLVATVLMAALLATAHGVHPVWSLVVLAIPSLWRSVHNALPEPLAAAFAAAALVCLARDRWRAAAACLAAAMLMRETVGVLVVVSAIFLWREGGRRPAIGLLAIALAPYALWRLYVGVMLYGDWGTEAFLFNPGVYGPPLVPLLDVYRSVRAGTYATAENISRAALWLPALLIAATAIAGYLLAIRRDIVSVSAAIYAVLALCLHRTQVWSHVGNVERTTYELFVLLALATMMRWPGGVRPRIVLSIFWAACAAYLLYGAYDAELTRFALFGLE